MRTFAIGILCFLVIASAGVQAQTTCDGVSPVNASTLEAVEVINSIFGRALYLTSPPNDTDQIYLVAQDGIIYRWERGSAPNGAVVFMDIQSRVFASGFENEAGLLGLAFDPDFANNGFFYVYYNDSGSGLFCGSPCESVVSRFTASGSPPVGNPNSELEIMRFTQPQSNHNGGHVFFGPDDFLYIATGDGGGANDNHGTCGNGQEEATWHGKLLRIDVNGVDPSGTAPDSSCWTGISTAANYTVPSTNAFADGVGGDCDEIHFTGLRNPWRNAFDRETGDLFIADVGQNCYEEINFVESAGLGGQNFGWRQMEGANCFDPADPSNCSASNVSCLGSADCFDPSYTNPIEEYAHSTGGCSVTGGYIYRGCRMPNFHGKYFYSDFCDGFVRSFEIGDDGMGNPIATNPEDWTSTLGLGVRPITSFGEDGRGEIYIIDRNGIVFKFMPPFEELEVSGEGAADQFLLNRSGNWTWEDLNRETMAPVDYYQVYRGVPNGTFECIHSTFSTDWAAGDTTDPNPGELLAYIVTAVQGSRESSSGDPARTTTNPCGPPP